MWITRDDRGYAPYDFWKIRPVKVSGNYETNIDYDGLIASLCSGEFERCCDLRLKPGEIVKIKRFTVVK